MPSRFLAKGRGVIGLPLQQPQVATRVTRFLEFCLIAGQLWAALDITHRHFGMHSIPPICALYNLMPLFVGLNSGCYALVANPACTAGRSGRNLPLGGALLYVPEAYAQTLECIKAALKSPLPVLLANVQPSY